MCQVACSVQHTHKGSTMQRITKQLFGAVLAVAFVLTAAHAFTVFGVETVVADDVEIAAASDSTETFDIGTSYGSGYRLPDLIVVSLECSTAAVAADSQVVFLVRNYDNDRATEIGETDSVRVVPAHKGDGTDWDGATIVLRPTATTYQVTISNPLSTGGKYAIRWRGLSQERY